MHRDIFRVFIVVSVVCFVAASAASAKKAIAQLDQSLILELFADADGSPCKMPCLFGIRPGETTIGEAKALIQAHPLTHSLHQLSVDEVAHMHGVYHPEMYMFSGLVGQYVNLQIVADREKYSFGTQQILPDDAVVMQVMLSSRQLFSSEGYPNIALPPLEPRLVEIWHTFSFQELIRNLGMPESDIFPYRYDAYDRNYQMTLNHAFYFGHRMIIDHSGPFYRLTEPTYFSSIALFAKSIPVPEWPGVDFSSIDSAWKNRNKVALGFRVFY